MMFLKNGLITQDNRLGRIYQHDPRNGRFPVMGALPPDVLELPLSQAPRSYTWPVPTILNQWDTPRCVGFSLTAELLAMPGKVRRMVGTKGILQVMDISKPATAEPVAEQIYWEAQFEDEWEGGEYPGASPFGQGTSVLAGAKALQKMGYWKEFSWATSEPELMLGVGHLGPAVIGINWYTNMFTPVKEGTETWVTIGGRVEGGHAILVRGFSIRRRAYLLQNSWGNTWGDRGCVWIGRDDMARLLAEEGEAVIATKRSINGQAYYPWSQNSH